MNRNGCSRQTPWPNRRAALRALCFALVLSVCAAPLHASPNADKKKELQLRAAFLLNFIKFTEWPDDAFADREADFVIAIVGPDPFGPILEQTFAKLKVHEREVVIRRWSVPNPDAFKSASDFDEALAELHQRIRSAHLVYLTICEPDELDRALERVDTSRVLTVGSEYKCSAARTALALDRDGDRIILFANTRIIKSLKLQVSSRLLALAKGADDPDHRGDKP